MEKHLRAREHLSSSRGVVVSIPHGSQRFPFSIVRVAGSEPGQTREDALAVEEPLEIQLGYERKGWRVHKSVSVTMRTPRADEELAVGFLFSEGIIADPAQIDTARGVSRQKSPPVKPPTQYPSYSMSFLDREAIVAKPGYSRWMFPPAASAVQMCIGQVYAFCVFNVPLTKLIGKTKPAEGDWDIPSVGWIYSIALIMPGLSAAVFGKWVKRSGPRKTMVTSALCFGGGLWISAIGVAYHQLGLIYLGYGVLGGIGLGMGYIAPVSTLLNGSRIAPAWRRGLPSWVSAVAR